MAEKRTADRDEIRQNYSPSRARIVEQMVKHGLKAAVYVRSAEGANISPAAARRISRPE